MVNETRILKKQEETKSTGEENVLENIWKNRLTRWEIMELYKKIQRLG